MGSFSSIEAPCEPATLDPPRIFGALYAYPVPHSCGFQARPPQEGCGFLPCRPLPLPLFLLPASSGASVLQRHLLDRLTAANRKRLAQSLFEGHIREARSTLLLPTQPIHFPSVNAKLIHICSQRQDSAPKLFTERFRQEDNVEVPAVSLRQSELPR